MKRECLAILMAIDRLRPHLMHQEFLIRRDQQSLTHLEDQRLSTPWQQKAMTRLFNLHYRISYKKGKENRVTHALSCRDHTTQE